MPMKKILFILALLFCVPSLFAHTVDYRFYGGNVCELTVPESLIASEDGCLDFYPVLSEAAAVDTGVVLKIYDGGHRPIGTANIDIPRGNASAKKGVYKFKNEEIKAGCKYYVTFEGAQMFLWVN